MALDFRAQMFGGNKRKINNLPDIEAVLYDPDRVDELFECVKDQDEYVRMRASDALEKVCRSDPSIVQPLKTRVLNEMSNQAYSGITLKLLTSCTSLRKRQHR